MKHLTVTLILLLSTFANANSLDIRFRCTDRSIENCEQRVLNELDNKACGYDINTLECVQGEEDIYCAIESNNCFEASSDGFTGVNCQQGKKVKISDRKLTATWARSILWIWVKDMCVKS